MKAKIIATPTTGRHLLPGDLFSARGPEYWSDALDRGGIGDKVFIRTNNPVLPSDADELIYRIEIRRETP